MHKFRWLRLHKLAFPFVLLLICVLSYGNMATKLGFYWDDWFIAYFSHIFGADIFPKATVIDRPLLGWLYTLIISLIGESLAGWQVFAVLTRYLLGLSLWWLLRQLWPNKPQATAGITLLFVIYPSFKQQHIAITYGIAFLIYTLFFTSIALMIMAHRSKNNQATVNPNTNISYQDQKFWLLTILALVSQTLVFFTAEYFYGLELLRPAILWIILSEITQDFRQHLRKTIINWSPYALVMFILLLYRIIYETPRGEITFFSKFSNDPISTLLKLVKTMVGDSFMVSVLAWFQTLQISSLFEYGWITIFRYVLIILFSALLTAGYFYLINRNKDHVRPKPDHFTKKWGWQPFLLGILALFVSGIPFWMTDLKIQLSFTRDRFTLPMMIGAALLIFGTFEILSRRKWQTAILVSLLVGLASGMHFSNTLTYRKEWLTQKDFFWQLVWRAPGIETGTIILTTEMPFAYNFDGSLTAPLNWIYAPDNDAFALDYLYYDVESHLSRQKPDLTQDMQINKRYRLATFSGTLSQAVLLIYSPPACLKIVDPVLDARMPDKPRFFRTVLPFSRPELILTDTNSSAELPIHIFGAEPEKSWCYYFEKAELARQQGNWQRIVELGDQASVTDKQFQRSNVTELMPFIEGYLRAEQWETAIQLSLEAYQTWDNMHLMVCELWQGVERSTGLDISGQAAYNEISGKLKCTSK